MILTTSSSGMRADGVDDHEMSIKRDRTCRSLSKVPLFSSLGDAEAVSFLDKMVELWYEHEMASTRRRARDLSFAKIKSQAFPESDVTLPSQL